MKIRERERERERARASEREGEREVRKERQSNSRETNTIYSDSKVLKSKPCAINWVSYTYRT